MNYRTTLDFIKKKKHTLTRDWLDEALRYIKRGKPQPPRSKMYGEIMGAIKNSDVCIFDVTVKAMSVGQQIMYALNNKKPTLVVTCVLASDSAEDQFIAGSKSEFLTLKDYKTEEQLKNILEKFLQKNSHPPKSRLSLYLEKTLYDVLTDLSKKYKKTKSETLEILIAKKQERLNARKK